VPAAALAAACGNPTSACRRRGTSRMRTAALLPRCARRRSRRGASDARPADSSSGPGNDSASAPRARSAR